MQEAKEFMCVFHNWVIASTFINMSLDWPNNKWELLLHRKKEQKNTSRG